MATPALLPASGVQQLQSWLWRHQSRPVCRNPSPSRACGDSFRLCLQRPTTNALQASLNMRAMRLALPLTSTTLGRAPSTTAVPSAPAMPFPLHTPRKRQVLEDGLHRAHRLHLQSTPAHRRHRRLGPAHRAEASSPATLWERAIFGGYKFSEVYPGLLRLAPRHRRK